MHLHEGAQRAIKRDTHTEVNRSHSQSHPDKVFTVQTPPYSLILIRIHTFLLQGLPALEVNSSGCYTDSRVVFKRLQIEDATRFAERLMG